MALQVRRGLNAERLTITLVEGEVVFVTDNKYTTIEVTSINASTDVLTTTVDHELVTGYGVKFTSATSNGLTQNTIYYARVPADSTVNFTLYNTRANAIAGGATGLINITGTATSLMFDSTPRDVNYNPLSNDISPLWVGDGVTVGGIAAGATTLDELADVEIGTYGNVLQYGEALADGQLLVYNDVTSRWENTNDVRVTTVDNVTNFSRENDFSADTGVTTRTALKVTKKNTGGVTGESKGGPAILFQSQGTNSANDTSLIQIGALHQSTGDHDFIIYGSNDNFTTFEELFKTNKSYTIMHDGVLYVNDVNNRVGVNNTNPSYDLDVTGNIRATTGAYIDSLRFGIAAATTIDTGSGNLVLDSDTGLTQINDNLTVSGDVTANGATLGNVTVGLTDNNTITTTTGNLTINCATGSVTFDGDIAVNGGDITTTAASTTIFGTTATAIQLGGSSATVTIPGNLTVNGTTTNINTTNLVVEDKNIVLGDVTTPSDTTANGGGITLLGTTDKTITWTSASNKWNLSHGLYIAGDFVTGTGHDMYFNAGSYTNGATYGIIHSASTGNTAFGNDLAIHGNEIKLNYGASTGVDSYIYVERGATDSYIRWVEGNALWNATNDFKVDNDLYAGNSIYANGNTLTLNNGNTLPEDVQIIAERGTGNTDATISWSESSGAWIVSDQLVSIGTLGTNGLEIVFNNDDGSLNTSDRATLRVKRGAGADVALRWNENTDRWETTSDGSSYVEIPNQGLDTDDSPIFWGVQGGSIKVGVTGDNEIDTTSGNLTIDSAGGTVTVDDNLTISGDITHNGSTATFNNNVTLGSNSSDTLTINSIPTFNTNPTFQVGITVNGTTTLNDDVALGSSTNDTVTFNGLVAGDIVFTNNTTDTERGIKGTVGTNDYWRFGGGATGTDAGYAEIATGDNGTEPIYVRQYNGASVLNEIQLLDSTGVTKLNDITVTGIFMNDVVGKNTSTLTTTSTSQVEFHTFSKLTRRSCRYTIQMSRGSEYQVVECIVLHNGTEAFITTFADIKTGSNNLATFNADISGDNVRLLVTPTSATSTDFIADRTVIVV